MLSACSYVYADKFTACVRNVRLPKCSVFCLFFFATMWWWIIQNARRNSVLTCFVEFTSGRSWTNSLTGCRQRLELELSLSRKPDETLTLQSAKVIIVPHRIVYEVDTHWPLMDGLLYLVARPWALLAVKIVTAHTSTPSVPITILLIDV